MDPSDLLEWSKYIIPAILSGLMVYWKTRQETGTAIDRKLSEHLDRLDRENGDLRDRVRLLESDQTDLHREVQMLQHTIDQDPIPMWSKRADDLTMANCNAAWERLTGLKRRDVIGLNNEQMFEKGLISRAQADDWNTGDRRAIEAQGVPIKQEERSVTPMGETRGKSVKWLVTVITIGNERLVCGRFIDYDQFGPETDA